MSEALGNALKSVDWDLNISEFIGEADILNGIDAALRRMAVWSKQLENIDSSNPAISFIRAMQSSAHHAICTTSLGLYRASAGSIRSIVENALYYSYFRVHPAELASLVNNPSYYISKAEIIEFHLSHTPGFKLFQSKMGLVARTEKWYSEISAIVHGQLPGVWQKGRGISDTSFNLETLKEVSAHFVAAEMIVHEFFLITLAKFHWDDISFTAKKALLKGMDGEKKALLQLDLH